MTTYAPPVGHMVFTSTRKASGDPAALKAALTTHCPALAGAVPDPLKPHTAIRHATRRKAPQGYRWADVGLDGDVYVVALTEATSDPSLKDYRESTAAWVAVDSLGAWIDDPGVNATTADAVTMAHKRYDEARGALGAEALWDIVAAACKKQGGVRLRDGLVFVPTATDPALDYAAQVEAAYAEASCGVTVVRVAAGADAATAVAATVELSMWDVVDGMERGLAARAARSEKSGRAPRVDGTINTLRELQEAEDTAALMEMAVGAKVGDLRRHIAVLRQRAKDIASGPASGPAVTPATPTMDADEAADRAALGLT